MADGRSRLVERALAESVDDFATDILNMAKIIMIPITAENLVKFSIIKGLRSEIKQHVLNSSTKTSGTPASNYSTSSSPQPAFVSANSWPSSVRI